MSLLLDALKKAEQAKREKAAAEVAAGAGPTGGPAPRPPAAGGGELQLEPLPEDRLRQAETAERRGEAAPDEPREPAAGEEPEASSTLRLHLDEARRVAEEEGLDLEEFQRRLAEAAPPMGDTGSLGALDVRETTSSGGQTLPSLKNVQAALRDFYGEPGARESEPASTLTVARPAAARPSPAAEALATTQASTQEARRAARNVFDAKRRPARTARGPWGLLGVTAVLVAVLAVGGYYAAMTFTTVQPSSLAISRQPVSRPPALPPESGPPAGTPAPAPAASAPTTVAQAPTAPAAAAPSTPAGTPASAAPAGPAPEAADQAPAAPTPARPAQAPTEEEAYRLATRAPAPRQPRAEAAGQAVAQATPPAPLAPAAPAPAAARAPGPAEPAGGALFPEPPGPAASARPARASPVRVAARTAPDPTYANLTRAYNAYQAGGYAEARRIYQQVLAREPTNRDALLGLGAANAAEGRTDQARAAYQRALILNPRDEVAASGLMSLRSGAAPQDEARLRQLVQQQPGAPHLRFALGNAYAAQGRWSEAQQAYFDAFRGDSRNADYAFNLAVSLDHLAQGRAALDYYRRALALGGGRFDADAARERIRVLEESGSGS